MSNRMNDGLRRMLCVLAMGFTGVAASPLALASSNPDDATADGWSIIVRPERPDIGQAVPPHGELIPIARPPRDLPPLVVVQPPPVQLPPVAEPPVLTAQVVIGQAEAEMWQVIGILNWSCSATHSQVLADATTSGSPASKQAIAGARSQYQSHSKAAQAQIKAIQAQAAAQLQALGASKEQRKSLSVLAKQYRAQSKAGARSWSDQTQTLGAL